LSGMGRVMTAFGQPLFDLLRSNSPPFSVGQSEKDVTPISAKRFVG